MKGYQISGLPGFFLGGWVWGGRNFTPLKDLGKRWLGGSVAMALLALAIDTRHNWLPLSNREHENRFFPSRKKNQPSKSQKRTVDSRTWKKRIYHDSKKTTFNQSIMMGKITHWYMDVSKNSGTPKSSILIGFSIINHSFWGTPIFGNTHISSDQKPVNDQPPTHLSIYPSMNPPHRSFGSDQKSVSTMLHSSLPFGTFYKTVNPQFPIEQ